jgi:hypothetical protein
MAKKTKNDYWVFTIVTEYNAYATLYCTGFPTRSQLLKACHDRNGSKYEIVNITKLTEEQYVKLTGKEVSE